MVQINRDPYPQTAATTSSASMNLFSSTGTQYTSSPAYYTTIQTFDCDGVAYLFYIVPPTTVSLLPIYHESSLTYVGRRLRNA